MDTASLLDFACSSAQRYIDTIDQRRVFPSEDDLKGLKIFEEPFPSAPSSPLAVLELLEKFGAPCTSAQTGGRYFGFVNGGVLPVALAAEWISDAWNQNGALRLMSPVASKLEDVCEKWITDLFRLEPGTAMGLVTGSSNALICGLAAGRNHLLKNLGYDIKEEGFCGAPKLRVVASKDIHSAALMALAVLGFGRKEIELVPTDENGRVILEKVPPLDERTLCVFQAGNVNGGAFDPIEELCEKANKAGAWIHIDGAFALWVRTSTKYGHLVKGMERADSWSVDAHKSLNAGYDCGIVLCRHRESLISALQAQGSYLAYSTERDNMLYTTEMSRRTRGVILWAVLKTLGRKGVDELITRLCDLTVYFAQGLKKAGFTLVASPSFNQFMVRCGDEAETQRVLREIQGSGKCWAGGSKWKGKAVIRLSVCSWKTTQKDIDESIEVFREALRERP